ncbi:hypothetical protein CDD81_2222 [Ophiocordyceps australis]|uniref:Uncharacterized protein n=1 Tax=Ophiocordyceps australis TaxID=1399860 RepID=A0A2C5XET1_9HYPO|nr:hypothetical protein CDD81_2222 [Ophiocordyceps australis]
MDPEFLAAIMDPEFLATLMDPNYLATLMAANGQGENVAGNAVPPDAQAALIPGAQAAGDPDMQDDVDAMMEAEGYAARMEASGLGFDRPPDGLTFNMGPNGLTPVREIDAFDIDFFDIDMQDDDLAHTLGANGQVSNFRVVGRDPMNPNNTDFNVGVNAQSSNTRANSFSIDTEGIPELMAEMAVPEIWGIEELTGPYRFETRMERVARFRANARRAREEFNRAAPRTEANRVAPRTETNGVAPKMEPNGVAPKMEVDNAVPSREANGSVEVKREANGSVEVKRESNGSVEVKREANEDLANEAPANEAPVNEAPIASAEQTNASLIPSIVREILRPLAPNRILTITGQNKSVISMDQLCSLPANKRLRWAMDLYTIVSMPPAPESNQQAIEDMRQSMVFKVERPEEVADVDHVAPSLKEEHALHRQVFERFEHWRERVSCHVMVPKPSKWFEEIGTLTVGVNFGGYTMDRMLPFVDCTRTALCELMVGAFDMAKHKSPDNLLVSPRLGTCAIRPWTGEFYNVPLHVEWMRELNIDSRTYAQALGEAFAVLHWGARVTTQGVEFAVGTRDVTREFEAVKEMGTRQDLCATQLYAFHFGEVEEVTFVEDLAVNYDTYNLLGSCMADRDNMVYLPDPVEGDYLFHKFRAAYIKCGRKIVKRAHDLKLGLHTPESVIFAWTARWRDSMRG